MPRTLRRIGLVLAALVLSMSGLALVATTADATSVCSLSGCYHDGVWYKHYVGGNSVNDCVYARITVGSPSTGGTYKNSGVHGSAITHSEYGISCGHNWNRPAGTLSAQIRIYSSSTSTGLSTVPCATSLVHTNTASSPYYISFDTGTKHCGGHYAWATVLSKISIGGLVHSNTYVTARIHCYSSC